uniref:Tc1-like transposase DDE domain-containing protein n=1 Tax=Clastoptera arizonana TaxID=38151 RepID=A0A1B6CU48_9HEMI
MNGKQYEEWFRKVLNLLPPMSAVVIDQAPYHTMLVPETKNPTMSWLKEDIVAWLIRRNIPLPPDAIQFQTLTKAALINHARPYFKPVRVIEQITKQLRPDVELIWLPVEHCELNAIELIWAYVKGAMAKVNRSNAEEKEGSINTTRALCEKKLKSVTPELWAKCVKHSINFENHYWEKDHINQEIQQIEPVIINLDSSDSESDWDEIELHDDISDCNE